MKLVCITLTNQDPQSLDKDVRINLSTGICTLANKKKIKLKHFLNEYSFSHPLLAEPRPKTTEKIFHYEYDDLESMYRSGIFVYATLLHVEQPHMCQFRINPSPLFQRQPIAKNIYFSMNGRKTAKESIHINQFEAIIQQLKNNTFAFSEDSIIDTLLTIENLPRSVNGDLLFKTQENISKEELNTLLQPLHNMNDYELRFISPTIGFGVFSRVAIEKDKILFLYSGIKTYPQKSTQYLFIAKKDCLNLDLDAGFQGNIARFVNHAPDRKKNTRHELQMPLLEANLISNTITFHGIETIAYISNRAIEKGEQLLVDYGSWYFMDKAMHRFKTNGDVVDANNKPIRDTTQARLAVKRVMANHGIKEAQHYLTFRMLSIIGITALLISILNYIQP